MQLMLLCVCVVQSDRCNPTTVELQEANEARVRLAGQLAGVEEEHARLDREAAAAKQAATEERARADALSVAREDLEVCVCMCVCVPGLSLGIGRHDPVGWTSKDAALRVQQCAVCASAPYVCVCASCPACAKCAVCARAAVLLCDGVGEL